MKPIRWGIIGCGGIAHKFAKSMQVVDTGDVVACASRTPGKAAAFASAQGLPAAFDNYEALVESPEVDAVYIATTHNYHHENIKLALEAGKAVLCEKPITVNTSEAREVAALARQKGLFLMEGMWTRFLPVIRKVRAWLDEGAIGEIRTLRADFCIDVIKDPKHRIYNPDLAGGALLDAGIYPVSMASFVMGEQPERVTALAHMGETNVDESTGALFGYENGQLALLSCSVNSGSANRLEIAGTQGRIEIPGNFLSADRAVLSPKKGDPVRHETPFKAEHGFSFEIAAANTAIAGGQIEHDVIPLDESVAIMATMDRIRQLMK